MVKRPSPGRHPAAPAAASADRVRERYERLLGSIGGLLARHRLGEVLQEVVEAARDVVGARYAAIGVLASDRRSLAEFVTSGISAAERERIGDMPQGRGLLGLLMHEGRPIRTAEIRRHPQSYGFPAGHPEMRSFLGVPINTARGVFGNLYLTDKVGAPEFTAEDEAIAVLLAAQAGVAVENARLFEETERLLAEVQAMQRQRDLFFAMMNHELRNALTGVFGWAERLVRARGGDPTLAAQEVYEGAERTVALLNDVLDLTRLDAGKVHAVTREVDVRGVVQRAVAGLEPQAEPRRIEIVTTCPDAPPPLTTDPVRLQQILTNLLGNAVRHSPDAAVVRVTVEVTRRQFLLTVSDEGSGIPVELQERIFEPFERVNPESGTGVGLGLAISRRLAQVLGGTLTVSSTPGEGARFLLSLPREYTGAD